MRLINAVSILAVLSGSMAQTIVASSNSEIPTVVVPQQTGPSFAPAQTSSPPLSQGATNSAAPINPSGANSSTAPANPSAANNSTAPINQGGATNSTAPINPGGATNSTAPAEVLKSCRRPHVFTNPEKKEMNDVLAVLTLLLQFQLFVNPDRSKDDTMYNQLLPIYRQAKVLLKNMNMK